MEYLSYYFLTLALLFIYAHYDRISSQKPSHFKNYLVLGLGLINLTLLTIGFLNLYRDFYFISPIIYILISIFGIICFIPPLINALRARRIIKERAIFIEILSLVLILFGCFAYLIGSISYMIDYSAFITLLNDLTSMGDILILIALNLIMLNYIFNRDYIYRIPFPVHNFLIFNKGGVMIYNRDVITMDIPELDFSKKLIVSGILNAISEMIKKTLGEQSNLRFIDAESYQILFSKIPKIESMVAVISSGYNKILLKSLDQFANSIPVQLIEKMSKSSEEKQEINKNIDSLLLKSFPYITLKK
jgi:hypothetical protein